MGLGRSGKASTPSAPVTAAFWDGPDGGSATILPGVALPGWAEAEVHPERGDYVPLVEEPAYAPAYAQELPPPATPAPLPPPPAVMAAPVAMAPPPPALAPPAADWTTPVTFPPPPVAAAPPVGHPSLDAGTLAMLPPPVIGTAYGTTALLAPPEAPAVAWPDTVPADWTADAAPAAAGTDEPASAGRSRRPRLLVLLLLLVAALAAAFWFLVMPMLSGTGEEEAVVPTGPSVTTPATLAGLPVLTTPAAAAAVKAAVGSAPTSTRAAMAAGYGKGPVTLAVAAATAGASNPGTAISSRLRGFATRTSGTIGAALTVPLAGSTMQCASTTAVKGLPAGSLCVWADPRGTGQVWVAGATPAKAAVVATTAHGAVTKG